MVSRKHSDEQTISGKTVGYVDWSRAQEPPGEGFQATEEMPPSPTCLLHYVEVADEQEETGQGSSHPGGE